MKAQLKKGREYAGRVLVAVLPRRVLARFENEFFNTTATEGQFARTIRAGLNRRFYAQPDAEQRRLNRERLWGGQAGVEWHEQQRRLHGGGEPGEAFLRYRRPLVEQLQALTAADGRYTTVCEIGTGNGLFLDYLSRQLPSIGRFVGIDINQAQIARNKEVYAGTRLEFVSEEVDRWLASQVTGPTIFVAAGTLECFTQTELVDLFQRVRALAVPCAIGLCEPVNVDLASATLSAPRGNTMYSHNYPRLLSAAGYTVFQQHVEEIDPAQPFYQMVVMVART